MFIVVKENNDGGSIRIGISKDGDVCFAEVPKDGCEFVKKQDAENFRVMAEKSSYIPNSGLKVVEVKDVK